MAALGGGGGLEQTDVRVITDRGHQNVGLLGHLADLEKIFAVLFDSSLSVLSENLLLT